MVLEAVMFTIMIILAVMFVSQLSPPPVSSTGGRSSAQWRILCDDALRSIEVSPYVYKYVVGDVDKTDKIDVNDIVYLTNWLSVPGAPPPKKPIFRADCNCDGQISAEDVQYLILSEFCGGPQPYCPYNLSQQGILATCIIFNDTTNVTRYFNAIFPDTCIYNIYIGNGIETVLWYNGGVGRGGNIISVHRVISVEDYFLKLAKSYPNGEIIPGYSGNMYIVTLTVEYL
jgi:hypothetical protein